MTTKYKASQSRCLKIALLLLALTFLSHSQAQIVGGPEDENPDQKDKKDKNPRNKMNRDSLSGTTYYATGMFNYGYRFFSDNTIGGTYSDWNFQKPDASGGATIGILFPLTNSLDLDMGFTYFGHKEQYTYIHPVPDSSFFYSNTYMHIGMPVKLRYTYGDKVQLFGFLGLTPLNIVNIRYNETYTRSSGATTISDVSVIKDEKLAIFNIMATAGFGITYNFDWFGITLYPEWRQHLLNTYNSQKSLDHKMFGFGINMGLTLRF